MLELTFNNSGAELMINPLLSGSSLLSKEGLSGLLPKTGQFAKGTQADLKNNSATQNRDSFALFNKVLQQAYQRLSENQFSKFSGQPSESNAQLASPYAKVSPSNDKITSDQAAGNILDFITQRLKSDAAQGASKEALVERLEQGLSGFIEGFNEAKEQIEALGLLTPKLAEEIGETYKKVTEGIDALRNQINDGSLLTNKPKSTTALNRASISGSASEQETFSLSLVTQDGDRVNIEIAKASQSSFAANSGAEQINLGYQTSSSKLFELSVEGELDEEELGAINDLLQDVQGIASEFYQGDLDDAFSLAQELQIDRDQLSSLNLELTKTTTTKAVAAYESAGGGSPSLPFQSLQQLFDRVETLLDNARKFSEPLSLLDDVVSAVEQLGFAQNNQQGADDLKNNLNDLISKFEL